MDPSIVGTKPFATMCKPVRKQISAGALDLQRSVRE